MADFGLLHGRSKMAYNVIGLGEVCEALACAVGQIAPNPCYTLAQVVKTKLKLEHGKKENKCEAREK